MTLVLKPPAKGWFHDSGLEISRQKEWFENSGLESHPPANRVGFMSFMTLALKRQPTGLVS